MASRYSWADHRVCQRHPIQSDRPPYRFSKVRERCGEKDPSASVSVQHSGWAVIRLLIRILLNLGSTKKFRMSNVITTCFISFRVQIQTGTVVIDLKSW